MKKASKKTAKKAAKKKPVSFDDVVDSAPAPVGPIGSPCDPAQGWETIDPVSQANSHILVELEKAVGAAPGSVFGLDPAFITEELQDEVTASPAVVYHKLGTEPGDEEEEWDPVESQEQALGIEATQEPSAGHSGLLSQSEPEPQPQTLSDAKEVHVAGLPPFNPDDVNLPVVSPMLHETIEVFSSLMEAFQWLYRRTKKKVRLLPEDDGKLHHRWGKAEAHMNKLKKIQ